MPSNRLILRSTPSPYIFPLSDIVKGSVLSWNEVDNNFIFLKGLNIQNGSVNGSDLVLNRINGDTINIDLSAFTGGTGTDVFVTGGTYNQSNGIATFVNNTGGTFTLTGFTTGFTGTDVFVTGGTYNSSASTITFTNNTGGTFTVTGVTSGGGSQYVNNIIPSGLTITVPQNQQYIVYGDLTLAGQLDNLGDVVIIDGSIINSGGTLNNSGTTTFVSFTGSTGTDYYTTGFTFNPANYDLTVSLNNGNNLTQNLGILAGDLNVTGGTYNPANGVATFTNNSGGTFQVTGFLTGFTDVYTTGVTLNGNSIEFDRTDTSNAYSVDLSPILSGFSGTDVFVTGGTYSSSASTITFTNNTGGTFTVTGISGGTSGGTASPAGSDTFIQFNDAGSFGANSGLTYDNTFNNFFTESKIGTKTTTLTNGITDIYGQSTSGATGILYNNSLSGASEFTSVLVGDIGGVDNRTFIGYFDSSTLNSSSADFKPEGIELLNYDPLAYQGDLTISPQNNIVRLRYDDNILNTTGELEITDSKSYLRFDDGVSGTTSFLTLESDGVNLRHNTGGSASTGIFIDDNSQISVNLDNTGITQSFIVSRQPLTSMAPSTKFEVDTDGYVTINNLYTLPNVDGSPNQVLQTDGSGNVSWTSLSNFGLFAQTADSVTISATTTETPILGSGVGTLTVPANSFQVGDSFHAKIGGVISAANNENLTIRIKTGASTLATLGPIQLTTTTSEFWELEIDFTIRSLGASARLQTNGQFNYVDVGGSGTYLGSGFNTNTTIDTTSSNSLDITAQWGSTNASNSIMSDIFYLKKTY